MFVVVLVVCFNFQIIFLVYIRLLCERYRSSENKYVRGYIDNYKCMFVSATANKSIRFFPHEHAVVGFL